jgi:CRISPR/Cas system CMR subunit Cmr6 (Cas7 group RAMP superfamily)
LAASRYVDFPNDGEDDAWRRRTSVSIKEGACLSGPKLQRWRNFALAVAGTEGAASPRLLFARQESRLLVNSAGGVFENGGLALDRISGVPMIPGSAVKGCARRLALAVLWEWIDGHLPVGDSPNLLAPAREAFHEPADLLVEIALVFGWSDLDWKDQDEFPTDEAWVNKRSDFAWACGRDWTGLRREVTQELCDRLGISRTDSVAPWKSLPSFSGMIAFLPAYPWEKDPGIELDVVTCHHVDYYRENPSYEDAWDTEAPVPVIFPTVGPGQLWIFLLHPTPQARPEHLAHARRWLAMGLDAYGIGGKTNAGYGWFDASDKIATAIHERLAAEQRRADDEKRRQIDEKRIRDDEEARRLAREAEEALTAGMSADEKADWKVSRLSTEQFNSKLRAFHKDPRKGGPSEEERAAIIRALRCSRLDAWTEFKAKAVKGELAAAANAMRELNKKLNGDKMP